MFWTNRPLTSSKSFRSSKHIFALRAFQWRFAWTFTAIVALALLLSAGPLFYSMAENFKIFIELAYQSMPRILDDLEREQSTLYLTSFFITTSVLLFSLRFSFKMSEKMMGPLFLLQGRLRQMAKGHFFHSEIRVREGDEFLELVETFNYFQASLKVNVESETEELRALLQYNIPQEARKTLLKLLEKKESQIAYQRPLGFSNEQLEKISEVVAS